MRRRTEVRWRGPGAGARAMRAVALAVAISVSLAGCLPLPDVRAPLPAMPDAYRVEPARVTSRAVRVAGTDVASTPDAYDAQTTLRWALDEPAETIVIAMPGLFGGATSFAPLARRLVASVPGLQVWAVDRRANALEDREPLLRALNRRDPSGLVAAYLGTDDAPPTFTPPDPGAHRFVADWGLRVHLADLDAVVEEARALAPRVVLAGHSMGASLIAAYAAWQTPSGPGHGKIDGLILIDGAPGRTGAFGFERGFRLLGVPVVLPSRDALERGDVPPWVTLGPNGADFAVRLVSAVHGAFTPDADAPEGVLPFPASSRAWAGLVHDDQYGAFQVFSASLGVATDADLDGNLLGFVLGGPWASRSASVVGVAPGADRVGWAPGDPAVERTDLTEYLAGWTDRRADANEWYMPLRLLQELTALPPDLRDVPGFVPMSTVPTATLAVGSDRGLLRGGDAFGGYGQQRLGAPFTVAFLPGLTHQDLLTARGNPLVPLAARWIGLLP